MDNIQPQENQIPQSQNQIPTTPIQIGDIELPLHVYEYAPHERSNQWVYIMVAVAIVLAIGFIFFEGIGAFSFIAALIALIVVYYQIHSKSSPKDMMDVSLTNFGVVIGGRFTPYTEINFYYIHSFPTHNTLNFSLKNNRKLDLVVFLPKEIEFIQIRQTLKTHKITENFEVKESPLDYLIRLLKL